MNAEDVVELIRLLEANGIELCVDGGWGIDALLGRQTRAHDDLDVVVQHKDVPALRRLLTIYGYEELPRESEGDLTLVFSDAKARRIDVHPYTFDSQGNLVSGIAYPIDSLAGTGVINGHPVKCISAEWAVKFHTQYEPDGLDFQDVHAVCERFSIQLPESYKKFLP